MIVKKTILIVDSQIPTFDKDSASNRITEIAKFLAKHYNVYLVDWRKAIPNIDSKKYIKNLNDHNVTVYTPFINKYGILKGKNILSITFLKRSTLSGVTDRNYLNII